MSKNSKNSYGKQIALAIDVQPNALVCPNSQDWYSKAYFDEEDKNNYRLVMTNHPTKISTVLFENLIQASDCDWSEVDDVLDSMDIDVCPLSVMTSVCTYDLNTSFETLKGVNIDGTGEGVNDFMNFYRDELQKEVKSEISQLRWNGNTGLTSSSFLKECDGYLVKFASDADIIDVTGTTITVSNVIAEMGKVLLALPSEVQANVGKKLRFYVSANVATSFKIAASLGNNGAYITQDLRMYFTDIPVIVAPAMPANQMVATEFTNLIYSFGASNDQIETVNLYKSIAVPQLRTRIDLFVGFYYTNGNQIAWYH